MAGEVTLTSQDGQEISKCILERWNRFLLNIIFRGCCRCDQTVKNRLADASRFRIRRRK